MQRASSMVGIGLLNQWVEQIHLVQRASVASSQMAHIITSARYAIKDASGKVTNHQTLATDTNMHLNSRSFKTGRQQLRNLEEWTRKNPYSLKKELLNHYELSQAQSNEKLTPEEDGCLEYENGYSSAGGSVGVVSEPYVLVDRPTPPDL